MNTASWGGKGWSFLHLVAQRYDKSKSDVYKRFFTVLKDVLPCIYCRNSYAEFIGELPITDKVLSSQREFTYWFYQVHNKVNDKLRKQGLNTHDDPSFEAVYNKYERIIAENKLDNFHMSCNMWYFVMAIAFNFDPEKHNIPGYKEFMGLLVHVLPYGPKYTSVFKRALEEYPINDLCFKDRGDLTVCLYLINESVNTQLGLHMITYPRLCNRYEKIRANCNPAKGQPSTCRLPNRVTRCTAKTLKGRQCRHDKCPGSTVCIHHLKARDM